MSYIVGAHAASPAAVRGRPGVKAPYLAQVTAIRCFVAWRCRPSAGCTGTMSR
jgi:hypothetical protein